MSKKTISFIQLGKELSDFCHHVGVEIAGKIYDRKKSVFSETVDRGVFKHEMKILSMWIVSKFLPVTDQDSRKATLDSMHETYTDTLKEYLPENEIEKEMNLISARYSEYYDAWNDQEPSEQWVFGNCVASNIVSEKQFNAKYQKESIQLTFFLIESFFEMFKEIEENFQFS